MEQLDEIWEYVYGYNNLYQVSTFGNVRSLDRYTITSLGIGKNV